MSKDNRGKTKEKPKIDDEKWEEIPIPPTPPPTPPPDDGPKFPKKPDLEPPVKPPKKPRKNFVQDDDKGIIYTPPKKGTTPHTQLHSGEGYRYSVTIIPKDGKINNVIIVDPSGNTRYPVRKQKGEEIISVIKQDGIVVITTTKKIVTYDAVAHKATKASY